MGRAFCNRTRACDDILHQVAEGLDAVQRFLWENFLFLHCNKKGDDFPRGFCLPSEQLFNRVIGPDEVIIVIQVLQKKGGQQDCHVLLFLAEEEPDIINIRRVALGKHC